MTICIHAGDALTAEGGHLNGLNPPLILDVREAPRSVRRLADLEIDTIVCYHGGVVGEDANGQLRRVIQEASGERAK
jgi:glyoxylase-like metal-dependent hydrolase (beta-lactamase superfamily II)